jgi:outer membrane protein assembly factor BamB
MGADFDASGGESTGPMLYMDRSEIVPGGNNAVLMNAHWVEKKFVSVETMKAQSHGTFEKKDLGVMDTVNFAEDTMNEWAKQRTGGVRSEDVSRYSVKLQPLLASDAGEWSGEVIGAPSLFSLPSVYLLTAGNELIAFDKNNKKLWEAHLAYPIDPSFRESGFSTFRRREAASAPAVERGDSIYFFDQGILTAFDRKSGAVRWRIPTVGVSQVQLDDQGKLYVTTTSRGQESIQYSDQVNLRDKKVGVIMKVDPATGRILWKAANVADELYLAGKYVYGTRAQVSNLEMITSFSSRKSAPTHFRIFRINPKDGEVLWTYYQPEEPLTLGFQGRTILWLARNELRVLRFLSL